MELGLNKPKTMLEQYQSFISAKNIFLALPGFSGKLHLCNNSCTTHWIHRMCTDVDALKSANIGPRTK